MCLTGAAATWSRTTSAKPWKRRAQSWLIRAMVAVTSFTPRRSANNSTNASRATTVVVPGISTKAPIRIPYCAPGALTPSGNAARVFAPQAGHRRSGCAGDLVGGRREAPARADRTPAGRCGRRSCPDRGPRRTDSDRVMIDDVIGISDLPQGLAFGSPSARPASSGRTLTFVTRAGFFSPSLDGGLPLFELFESELALKFGNPRLRDSFSALSAAISAIGSSVDGALGVSRIIRFLNRKPPTQSRKIYR